MWPELPLKDWQDTYDTLHMWTQIVGKISLKQNSFINHWWQCSLKINARGLTTGVMPYNEDAFEISFDFIDHVLVVRTTRGEVRQMSLSPKSVADFYFELMGLLRSLDIEVQIDLMPKEVPNPIPFNQDHTHYAYDREFAFRHWHILLHTEKVLEKFRSFFIGKASPVQFFWGTFDLTVSLFSGRRAPPRPEADHITQIGYSHEDFACGFWPGSGNIQAAAYYAYIAPEPAGFKNGISAPVKAFYNEQTMGYVLLYDDVRKSRNPEKMLLDFFTNTYNLAANLAKWDRENLERPNSQTQDDGRLGSILMH
jgi:Family of unknown function (DUF5996)